MTRGEAPGRATGNGVSFTDRHPEVVLVVFAAWCGFFAYAYTAGLASARNVVHEPWRAAVVGVVAGLALMTVIVVRYRQQKAGWLLVSPLACVLCCGAPLWLFALCGCPKRGVSESS